MSCAIIMPARENRVWRSLVSRLNGVQEAAGSNPVTRTMSSVHNGFELWTLDILFFIVCRPLGRRFSFFRQTLLLNGTPVWAMKVYYVCETVSEMNYWNKYPVFLITQQSALCCNFIQKTLLLFVECYVIMYMFQSGTVQKFLWPRMNNDELCKMENRRILRYKRESGVEICRHFDESKQKSSLSNTSKCCHDA